MKKPPKSLSKDFHKHLLDTEKHLLSNLKVVRALRRRSGGPAVKAMAAHAAAPAGQPKRVKIYDQLLGLFAAAGKPSGLIRPETVLGGALLGYDDQGLEDFYDVRVNPWFGSGVTTGGVGTDGTVGDLVIAIDNTNGQPR